MRIETLTPTGDAQTHSRMPHEPSGGRRGDRSLETDDSPLISREPLAVDRQLTLSRPHAEVALELPKVDAEPNLEQKRRGTFELKFLVDEARALKVIAWAREHLSPDPHCDPDFGDGYRVNSLYLDTPQFDVFHRMPGFRQQKFRLRRYGRESLVWFEQKRKKKGLVRKRRIPVVESDITTRLVLPANPEWDGHWFRHFVDSQGLTPVCQVTYDRFACMKATDEGPVRLTMDDRLIARVSNGWNVPDGALDGVILLENQRILELKFRGAMPVMFRRLIEQFQLEVTSFSKYRTSVEECISLDTLAGDELRGPSDA